jgi:hypothetical protein
MDLREPMVSSPKAWRISRAHLVRPLGPPERPPPARPKMARCRPKLVLALGTVRPMMSIWSAGGALTYRMTAETPRVRADIACVTYTCTCTITTHETSKMPLNRRFERRIKGSAASVAVSSFELNQRVLLLHLGIRTRPLVHQATKTARRCLS